VKNNNNKSKSKKNNALSYVYTMSTVLYLHELPSMTNDK